MNDLLLLLIILLIVSYLIATTIHVNKRERVAEEFYYRRVDRKVRDPFFVHPQDHGLTKALEEIAPHLMAYISLRDNPKNLSASLMWLTDTIRNRINNDTLPKDVKKWKNC